MKLAALHIEAQTKLPPGFKPGALILENVEATLLAGVGVAIQIPNTTKEHLIPWGRITGITRERQATK